MTLPTSRDYTITPDGVIPSTLLNTLQDQHVGRKFASHWRWTVPKRGLRELNINLGVSGGYDVVGASGDGAILQNAIEGLAVGDRITAIGMAMIGTGASTTCTMELGYSDGLGGHRSLGSPGDLCLTIADPPAAWAKYTHTLASPLVVVADYAYYWYITIGKNLSQFGPFGIQVDRL